jgi:hypothetical protein
MSRGAKIIIFGLILAFSIYNNQSDFSLLDFLKESKEKNLRSVNNNPPTAKKNTNHDYINSDYPNVFRLNKKIVTVLDKDLVVFKKKHPNAINVSYASRNESHPIWENPNILNTSKSKNKTTKSNKSNNTSKKGNVNEIGKYETVTRLISNREMTYTLFEDSKNIGKQIKKIYKKDNPKVYILKRGLFTSQVVLDYGNKEYYKGYVLNNIYNLPPHLKNDVSNSDLDKPFDIDSPDYLKIPSTGYSPYDSYFGKGQYADTDNYVEVTAPEKTHVVFVLINATTKKRIRNIFIRKGKKYKMTKIPYGTYDYMYFTGRNWSNEMTINKGKVKGAFKDFQSFNKNQFKKDQMEFERGYYGGYEIKLIQSIGGNLETQSTSENSFFN